MVEANRVGQLLGNYRLISLLDKGGFAQVYLAEHLHLGTQAAIKVFQVPMIQNDLDVFLSEARTIAHLQHPHIVRVLEAGVEGKTPFLVMEYAPKGTLRQRYPKGTRLPPETILLYVRQIADALQYAHDQRLIHRDIKPENLLLGPHDEVLLSDFGVAVVVQSSRSQGLQNVAGTVTYMAPEQVQAHPCPASDQYALGVIIYEWLNGAPPFDGSFTEIVSRHMLTPPPPLCEQVPSISPLVERVVLTALAKNPKERFPTIRAFAIAFEQACQDESNSHRILAQNLTLPGLVSPQKIAVVSPVAETVSSVPASQFASAPTVPEISATSSHQYAFQRRRAAQGALFGFVSGYLLFLLCWRIILPEIFGHLNLPDSALVTAIRIGSVVVGALIVGGISGFAQVSFQWKRAMLVFVGNFVVSALIIMVLGIALSIISVGFLGLFALLGALTGLVNGLLCGVIGGVTSSPFARQRALRGCAMGLAYGALCTVPALIAMYFLARVSPAQKGSASVTIIPILYTLIITAESGLLLGSIYGIGGPQDRFNARRFGRAMALGILSWSVLFLFVSHITYQIAYHAVTYDLNIGSKQNISPSDVIVVGFIVGILCAFSGGFSDYLKQLHFGLKWIHRPVKLTNE